jgi:hypothetical protein
MAASLGVRQLEQEFRITEYYPAGKEMSAEAEKSLLLEDVIGK